MAQRNPAFRRYKNRCLVASAAYIAAVALATWIVPDDSPPSAGPVALAVISGGAILGWIWAMGRLLLELNDEYLRMLTVRSMLVATGVTLTVTSIWGMIELYTTAPALPVFFVFPIWCLGLAIGSFVNKLTLGDAGGCP